jgi:hypothetical protein
LPPGGQTRRAAAGGVSTAKKPRFCRVISSLKTKRMRSFERYMALQQFTNETSGPLCKDLPRKSLPHSVASSDNSRKPATKKIKKTP